MPSKRMTKLHTAMSRPSSATAVATNSCVRPQRKSSKIGACSLQFIPSRPPWPTKHRGRKCATTLFCKASANCLAMRCVSTKIKARKSLPWCCSFSHTIDWTFIKAGASSPLQSTSCCSLLATSGSAVPAVEQAPLSRRTELAWRSPTERATSAASATATPNRAMGAKPSTAMSPVCWHNNCQPANCPSFWPPNRLSTPSKASADEDKT
mmetsp:Transcript_129347/g.413315  ORF Transcript_129347/g.413315 Transcript_129347/m.413315 type:complete len:209 (-) Transcript_129347:457-1083(-)